MRHPVAMLFLLAALSCRQGEAPAPDWSAVFDGTAGTWIDLSYAYSDETLYWPTADGFRLDVVARGLTPQGGEDPTRYAPGSSGAGPSGWPGWRS